MTLKKTLDVFFSAVWLDTCKARPKLEQIEDALLTNYFLISNMKKHLKTRKKHWFQSCLGSKQIVFKISKNEKKHLKQETLVF